MGFISRNVGFCWIMRLGQDLLDLNFTLGLIKFELMTDINSSFIDYWILIRQSIVIQIACVALHVSAARVCVKRSCGVCWVRSSMVLWERWVVHGHVMVAHTELWRSVHRQLAPLAPWWCFHGFLSLTVQEGEVRIETDLNLPQNLDVSILLKQKHQMRVSL